MYYGGQMQSEVQAAPHVTQNTLLARGVFFADVCYAQILTDTKARAVLTAVLSDTIVFGAEIRRYFSLGGIQTLLQ
jgi:hypothetical protein